MKAEVVIVHVGAEGGDIKLWGRRLGEDQWEFRRDIRDSSFAMLDEEADVHSLPKSNFLWVNSWGDGIALLDRNPWARLVPLAVHPMFRERVLVEATRRLLDEPSARATRCMDRWLAICGSP